MSSDSTRPIDRPTNRHESIVIILSQFNDSQSRLDKFYDSREPRIFLLRYFESLTRGQLNMLHSICELLNRPRPVYLSTRGIEQIRSKWKQKNRRWNGTASCENSHKRISPTAAVAAATTAGAGAAAAAGVGAGVAEKLAARQLINHFVACSERVLCCDSN